MHPTLNSNRGTNLKKATIIISLVDECNDRPNDTIENEFRKELAENISAIPWAKETLSVKVK